MKLLAVELRRFFSRRATRWFTAAGAAALLGVLTIVMVNSHSPSPEEWRLAAEAADRDRAANRAELSDCRDYWRLHPETVAPYDTPHPRDCLAAYDPSTIRDSDYLIGVLNLTDELPGQLAVLFLVFSLCGLLITGSFIGAEWSSGGMANLLLWCPNRGRVFAAKLVAAVIGVLTLTIGYGIIHVGALWGLAAVRGHVGTPTEEWWWQNLELAGRVLFIVMLVVCCAAALAMLGRRTVTAVGAVIGYGLVVEYGFRAVGEAVDVTGEMFTLSTYLNAWFDDGMVLHPRYSINHALDRFGDPPDAIVISDWAGGAVLSAVTVLLVAVALVVFRKRDVV